MVKTTLPALRSEPTRINQVALWHTGYSSVPSKKESERSLWVDYCKNSTIHGFKYFVGSKRTLVERVWWIIVCLLSVYGCGRLIYSVYKKWDLEPVVVTFAEKSIPVFSIPFPAIMVCPEIKARREVFNFTNSFELYSEPGIAQFMAKAQVDRLEALLQVCDSSFGVDMNNNSYDDDLAARLQEMAIPFEDIFVSCGWRARPVDCGLLFKKQLTEAGICYTFNSLAADDLMRKEALHPDYVFPEENISSMFWSMDEGFHDGTVGDSYPRRTFGAGIRAGMFVILKARMKDADYLCSNSFQGFKVHLYPPHQYPRVYTQFFRVPLGQEVSVSVDPLVIDTSPKIKSYNSNRRKCFYNRERKLRFFKLYTKNNCETECLSNYTLQSCGCVQFSLPRSPEARVCGLGKTFCCDQALSMLQQMDLLHEMNRSNNFLERCNCLSSCNTVYYNTEISQAQFDWRMLAERIRLISHEIDETELSLLTVHFKVSRVIPVRRSELYGVTDFLANCGGILGLFMGVSILSIVEILYYCTLKPFMARRRTDQAASVATRSKLILPPTGPARKEATKW
ncbi:pickpocket protein 28-like [Anopheles albimanus]|uniref:pickpocket protein 28-like n=1 Tax=Anopheles albimanus TaxID=7167 RepID=UPI001641BB7C|nr:pickpocket protein 28-like [Anopheles albimanus]XP_035790348.1 pickpocket protein 28-like [Anopheles albimanus]